MKLDFKSILIILLLIVIGILIYCCCGHCTNNGDPCPSSQDDTSRVEPGVTKEDTTKIATSTVVVYDKANHQTRLGKAAVRLFNVNGDGSVELLPFETGSTDVNGCYNVKLSGAISGKTLVNATWKDLAGTSFDNHTRIHLSCILDTIEIPITR